VFGAIASSDSVAGITLTAQWKASANPADDSDDDNGNNGGGDNGDNDNNDGNAGDGNVNDDNSGDGVTPEIPTPAVDDVMPEQTGIAENGTEITSNEDNAPMFRIGGIEVPLFGKPGTESWGLLNFVCLIVMIVVAIQSIFRFRAVRRRNKALPEWQDEYIREPIGKKWFVSEMFFAAVGVLVFFLTENIGGKMTVFDSYSTIQTVLMVGVIALHALTFRKVAGEKTDAEI
jgi:hypothetical protein